MPNDPPPPRITYVFIFVSINDSPVIVAGVTRFAEQLQPPFRIVVEFRGQPPALEDLFLLGREVAVDLNERGAAAHALDFPHRLYRGGTGKVVNGVDRQYAVEGAVWKRQPVRRSEVQPADDLLLAMRERIERNIQPERVQPGALEHQVLYQEPLAAADVQGAHARAQAEVSDDVPRDRTPAPVVAVSAVSVLARPVPVHFAKLLGNRDDRFILALGAPLHIPVGVWQRPEQVHFGHQLFSSISRCTRATPSSRGMKRMSGNALMVLATS